MKWQKEWRKWLEYVPAAPDSRWTNRLEDHSLQPFEGIELGLAARPVDAAVGAGLAADGGHDAIGSDFADDLVAGVPDEEIAHGIEGDAEGTPESDGGVRAVVATARTAEPCQGDDYASEDDFTNGMTGRGSHLI